MIKHLLQSIACLVACTSSVTAQTWLQQLQNGPGSSRVQLTRRAVLRNQAVRPQAKTTITTQRITGSRTTIQGSLNETVNYRYGSQERGSYHSPNDLNSYFFNFNPAGDNYPEVENQLEGGAPDIKCDSGIFAEGTGDTYKTVGLQYDASQRPTVYGVNYFSALTGNSSYRERYTLSYNGLGQRTEILWEVDTTTTTGSGSPYITDSRLYTIYGGTPARALMDSTVPLPGAPFQEGIYKVLYGYTGSNMTTIDYYAQAAGVGPFILYGRYRFTYDASNRVKTFEYLSDDGVGLVPMYKDSMTYTGSNPAPTATYYSTFDTVNGFQPVYSFRYTLNAQGLRDTMSFFDETDDLVGQAVYLYNSYGNPTEYNAYLYAYSTTVPYERTEFFYELHTPTSVSDARPELQAAVYPNPVRNRMALTWKAFSGRPTVRVIDAAGRTLEQITLTEGAAAHSLDMSRYAPGTYYVSVGNGTNVLQHLAVTKQ